MKKEITQGLNKYLADTAVLYIKWHNVHWNVVGRQFKSVHEYLETLYDAMAEVLDEVAELIKINNEVPLASMKDFLANTSVEELGSTEISVEKVLDIVEKDMEHMKKAAQDLREIADKDDAFDVVNMMEDHLVNYNKNIWFLKAMLK